MTLICDKEKVPTTLNPWHEMENTSTQCLWVLYDRSTRNVLSDPRGFLEVKPSVLFTISFNSDEISDKYMITGHQSYDSPESLPCHWSQSISIILLLPLWIVRIGHRVLSLPTAEEGPYYCQRPIVEEAQRVWTLNCWVAVLRCRPTVVEAPWLTTGLDLEASHRRHPHEKRRGSGAVVFLRVVHCRCWAGGTLPSLATLWRLDGRLVKVECLPWFLISRGGALIL